MADASAARIPVRTLLESAGRAIMQGIVSGLLLVGAFGVVAAAAAVFALRLLRTTRATAPGELPDA